MTTNNILTNVPDMPTAVMQLVQQRLERGEPFSSGEFVKEIRDARPDLVFRATTVGSILRSMFFNMEMPSYITDPCTGDSSYPVMVPRVTDGLFPDRTPAGVEVFVYAPTRQVGEDHIFEVCVTAPPVGVHVAPSVPQMAPVVLLASPPDLSKGQTAKVAPNDLRCYVNRSTLDALFHAADKAMTVGDNLHVSYDPNFERIHVAFVPSTTSKPYSIWQSSGRLAFFKPDNCPDSKYQAGQEFNVTITSKGLVIAV